jgi:putative ABC transport system ATP-binding protein
MQTLIELDNITKTFETKDVRTRALHALSLSIGVGEYVAFEGPSGCGKSTLLSILGLLDRPTSGSYRLNGVDLQKYGAGERARIRNCEIGFIFQNFNLISDLSISENVALPLVYAGVARAKRRGRVDEVLERVGIAHRATHFPPQLSGGEQQRAAVARSLVCDPALLLADEPTGNLDTANGKVVMDLLRELNAAGATVVMVTHDLRFAKQAGRTIRLLDGALETAEHVPSAVERLSMASDRAPAWAGASKW